MRFEAGLKLSLSILLLVGSAVLPTARATAQDRPAPTLPTMPGLDTGPPTLGEWYKPPELKVAPRPPDMTVREFIPNAREKRLLAVAPEDLQQNARFLSQPDAGVFRLLPLYPPARVVSANSPDIEWRRGFSAFASTYSFTKKKHGHGVNGKREPWFGWSDLRLKNDGTLRAGIMDESLGLMVQLGDVPLDEVTLQTAGVSELTTLVPPSNHKEAFALLVKYVSGYARNGFTYSSRMWAVVNTTYVLRSTLNRRADQLIAFRVVRLGPDEGLTIVWKKLQEYPKPSWFSNGRK